HDGHSYYTRLSAVFQEYLCAGIPVIAPANCWMGDEIAKGAGCGLAFSRRSEIPRLLCEMIALYPHYRARAQEQSPEWCRRLAPHVTWSELNVVAMTAEVNRSRAA